VGSSAPRSADWLDGRQCARHQSVIQQIAGHAQGKRARRWRRTDHPGFRRRGHFEIADKIANGVPLASGLMLGFGSAALVANLICLALLWCLPREM
jgi:hypothetical protein